MSQRYYQINFEADSSGDGSLYLFFREVKTIPTSAYLVGTWDNHLGLKYLQTRFISNLKELANVY